MQPERPAVGGFEEPRAGVRVNARSKAVANQRDRLVEAKAQHLGTDQQRLSIREQIAERHFEAAPRGDDNPQVRRRIVEHVSEHLGAVGRHPFDIVDEQHDVER